MVFSSFLSLLMSLLLFFFSAAVQPHLTAPEPPQQMTLTVIAREQQPAAAAVPPAPDEAKEPVTAEETTVSYIIRVVDQNGDPVAGAMINFCSDDMCQVFQTGAGGSFSCTCAPAVYHVQLLRVPGGYFISGASEQTAGTSGGTVTFTVTKNEE